jgi:hypothetical protein
MTWLNSIFLNPTIRRKVEETHLSIGDTSLSFQELLTVPHNCDPKDFKILLKNKKVNLDVLVDEFYHITPNFNKFGIYDMPACHYMEKRSDFIKEKGMGPLFRTVPKLYEIEEASLKATTPMVAYSIKQYVLSQGPEYFLDYKGILPYTKPVDVATRKLFKVNFSNSPYNHTVMCMQLAEELDTYPLYINTALWWLA